MTATIVFLLAWVGLVACVILPTAKKMLDERK